ncbi:unnamed protein product [Penicillium camemberti]|uniref:Str. FM013 n=1 Tax=Penicillium camemberti (strain FM 013) TaxID=1429867 RepID=A0A0G4P693_PENC3|nr:unnamed protein product [Penicillium camemberti]
MEHRHYRSPARTCHHPSSQDNTQHSRRQILTSSADPPCAFFTMQEKRHLPCSAAKPSQMIVLVSRCMTIGILRTP